MAPPDGRPINRWPIEAKLRAALANEDKDKDRADLAAMRASGARHREPWPIHKLEASMESCANSRLRELGEPPTTIDEVIGMRLYTGPLFVKYNSVLRGLDSAVPFLRDQFEKLCKQNKYTTTLHAINSAIVKLSKLTVATKVYRGIKGATLPEQFWKANKFGVRGGIESAFMSTTTDRDVALSYATGSNCGGFVFEIQQGTSQLEP